MRGFWEKSHWGAFGGPNRFCDERVGPQRSQSAPKNEKLAKMTEKWAENELKMAPKRAPRMKQSSKRGFFSQPKTMLENRPQNIGKTQKMNSNKSSKSEQSYSIQSRPGGLREALTIIVTYQFNCHSMFVFGPWQHVETLGSLWQHVESTGFLGDSPRSPRVVKDQKQTLNGN